MRWRRFRKWAKWTCTLAAGLAVGVAVFSGFYSISYHSVSKNRLTVRVYWIEGGLLDVGELGAPTQEWAHGFAGWQVFPKRSWYWGHWGGAESSAQGTGGFAGVAWHTGARTREVSVSVVYPVLLTTIPAALLWYADRRRFLPRQCQKCGYDRAGLAPDAECPECGTVPAPASK